MKKLIISLYKGKENAEVCKNTNYVLACLISQFNDKIISIDEQYEHLLFVTLDLSTLKITSYQVDDTVIIYDPITLNCVKISWEVLYGYKVEQFKKEL